MKKAHFLIRPAIKNNLMRYEGLSDESKKETLLSALFDLELSVDETLASRLLSKEALKSASESFSEMEFYTVNHQALKRVIAFTNHSHYGPWLRCELARFGTNTSVIGEILDSSDFPIKNIGLISFNEMLDATINACSNWYNSEKVLRADRDSKLFVDKLYECATKDKSLGEYYDR